MTRLRIIIAGAGGRMGQANIRAAAAHPDIVLAGAFDRPGAASIGKDAGLLAGIEALDVPVVESAETLLAGADAIIDFTAPAASVALARMAAQKGLVHVIGTTGCLEDEDAAIAEAGRNGARIVKSGNFSPGVVTLAALVEKAARALPDYDVEVLEMHHNLKVDAPSGTALMLGEAAAKGRDIDLRSHAVRARDGHTGPREAGSIGFATGARRAHRARPPRPGSHYFRQWRAARRALGGRTAGGALFHGRRARPQRLTSKGSTQ